MSDCIIPLPEDRYERILTRKTVFVSIVVGLLPLACLFAALLSALWVLPRDGKQPLDARQAFVVAMAAAVMALVSYQTLTQVGRASNRYLEKTARAVIGRRPDRILDPRDEALLFVEVVPRGNWGKPKLEDASDVGFLRIEEHGGRLLFEGGTERWIVEGGSWRTAARRRS